MTKQYTPLGIGVGSRIADRFEVLRRLGAGSMSVVFVVADISLNRETTALKLLSPAMTNDPNQVDRFRNEMLLTRKLTHPNIVRTHEFGNTPEGQYYITMEVVDGFSLEQMLKLSQSGLDIEECIYYLYHACQGVAYAHELGVIHRDLKPGNVLVSKKGEVKITDFGLARMIGVDDRLTRVGDCVGTPLYMAPEQIREGKLDCRTDIYGLGIIAYELVTGTVPHTGNAWFDLAEKIINNKIPEVGKLRKGVPTWLQAVIAKATDKNPDKRFDSVSEIAEILRPHLDEAVRPQSDTQLQIPRMHRGASRPQQTLMSGMFSYDWVGLAPRMMVVGLCALFVVLVLNLAEKNASEPSIETVVEKKTQAIGRFINNLERLNKVVVSSVENQDKFEEYLKQEELKEKQAKLEEEALAEEEALVDEEAKADLSEDLLDDY